MTNLPKRIQQIEEWNGLEANYGGGDYTITVWAAEDPETYEDGYELVYCKSNTNIAHAREFIPADQIESAMRQYQPDLRRWRKVEYGE